MKSVGGRPVGPMKVSRSIRIRPMVDSVIRNLSKSANVDYSSAVELLAFEFKHNREKVKE